MQALAEKLNHEELYMRARRLGKTQTRIAKELDRTPTTISMAFKGKRPVALARIKTYLDRVERKASEKTT